MKRPSLPLVVSVCVGVGAATLFIAVRHSPAQLAPVTAGAGYAPRITAATNKRPLSSRDKRAMLSWVAKVRSCAAAKSLSLQAPRVAQNEIILKPQTPVAMKELVTTLTPCVGANGGPPVLTSFVAENDGAMHFYKPRACLLPIHRGR